MYLLPNLHVDVGLQNQYLTTTKNGLDVLAWWLYSVYRIAGNLRWCKFTQSRLEFPGHAHAIAKRKAFYFSHKRRVFELCKYLHHS